MQDPELQAKCSETPGFEHTGLEIKQSTQIYNMASRFSSDSFKIELKTS